MNIADLPSEVGAAINIIGIIGCLVLPFLMSTFLDRFTGTKVGGFKRKQKQNDSYIDMALSVPPESDVIAPYDPEIFN